MRSRLLTAVWFGVGNMSCSPFDERYDEDAVLD